MKHSHFLYFLLLLSCGNNAITTTSSFKRILPDTSKSWSGRMTREDFLFTRPIEEKLYLETLLNGTKKQEFRIWGLHGGYDPQSLLIIKKINTNNWSVRKIYFNHSTNDSITLDLHKEVDAKHIDSFTLSDYWNLPSQSELKDGDSYSCMDGENIFIELADSTKYRFMWYRCPHSLQFKDSVFLKVSELTDNLNKLLKIK